MTTKQFQNFLRRFNSKQKNLNYFLAGFVDGEGSFSVAIVRHPTQKFGWMINPVFQVYQHEKNREILEIFHIVFRAGNIYRKSGIHPVLNFSIDSRRSIIEKVIPFFKKYPLIVKSDNFKKFKWIVEAMEKKEHWRESGFRKIVETAYSMNQQGKGRKYTKKFILSEAKMQLLTTRNPQRPTSEFRGRTE